MTCVVCKKGATRPGHTTVTLEKNGGALVVRHVPAEICENCGEAYVTAEVTRNLITSANQTLSTGVEVDIREFVPTSV
jgi:YgiT-type zinc finger domain-containing protein